VTDSPARFLGFAFASADLLFEIEPDGKIAFILGAVQRVMGLDQAAATGRSWRDLIAESDHDLVAALVDGLGPADRRGPVKVELVPHPERGMRRFAGFSACRLPQNAPKVSCVLTLAPSLGEPDAPTEEGSYGLYDQPGFMAATKRLLEGARSVGLDLNVELVQLKGLGEHAKKVDEEAAEQLFRRISAAIRAESFRGQGAAKIGQEQFALVRQRGDGPDQLSGRLTTAVTAAGAEVAVSAASLPLTPESTPLHTMRALRFALDNFLSHGADSAKAAFQTVLEATVTEANAFSAKVKDRKFQLVYQPVVELGSGALQHFEALVRLDGDKSPAKAIRMAEELQIIQGLDLAVVEQVVKKLKARDSGRLKLAANVSARSLTDPGFLPTLLRLVASDPALPGRLLFEITETTTIEDLDQANAAIQRLRQHGLAIFLDDFGAGSASMSYLKSLSVDGVKIDGQYIQDLNGEGRDVTLVRHLTELCRELKVDTVAEQVESQAVADALIKIGVRCGQGWHFGRPSAEPVYRPPSQTPVRVRRVGEVESWS
jgi:EAL domain-containing protein (putative c-di-GMP-specific phosphodiesterase class I)